MYCSWPAGGGSDQYNLYRTTDLSLPWEKVNSAPIGVASYTDLGLNPNTVYFYVARLHGSGGEADPAWTNVFYEATDPDETPPSVTVEQAAGQADPTALLPIRFDVTFSEGVAGFAKTDVTMGGSARTTCEGSPGEARRTGHLPDARPGRWPVPGPASAALPL